MTKSGTSIKIAPRINPNSQISTNIDNASVLIKKETEWLEICGEEDNVSTIEHFSSNKGFYFSGFHKNKWGLHFLKDVDFIEGIRNIQDRINT